MLHFSTVRNFTIVLSEITTSASVPDQIIKYPFVICYWLCLLALFLSSWAYNTDALDSLG